MRLPKLALCLAATLLGAPAHAKLSQQVPPSDAVTRIEQGYWNLTRRQNGLPEDSAYAGAEVIRCKG